MPPGSSTQSPLLTHLATVYYEKRSLDRLMAKFRFGQVGEPHPLPLNSGKTIQMNRYALPGFNTNPSSEGVVPSPVAQSSSTVSATIEQYSDFESSSTLLELTDINPTAARMVDDLSYRASGSVDTVIRLEVDSNSSAIYSSLSTYATAADFKFRTGVTLAGINVEPFSGNEYISIIHPYVVYDLISDNTAGGFIDAMKYQNGGQVLNGEVGMVGSCRLLTSTNVGTTGSAPNVFYYTYIFGKGGLGIVDLSGKGPVPVVDPKNQQFAVRVVPGAISSADPTGEVGTIASYWFAFAAKTLDSTNYRFAIVKHDASGV
jgi:N4-gp56 family major capsid protein